MVGSPRADAGEAAAARKRAAAWKAAARPHTLPAAVAPVLVGAGLAAGNGVFRTGALVASLVGALAIQVAANFANDVSDAARGADRADRLGPPRMVAAGVISPRAMWRATWAAIGVATVAGAYLIGVAGWVVALIGLTSIVALLTYVGGPLPYGYRGLGEGAVFVFFGLVATVGARYVHDRAAPLDAWLLGVVMGLLAAAILVANNLRDLDSDASAGKRTLAVMLGRPRTRVLYATLVYGAFVVVTAAAAFRLIPAPAVLAAVLAPFATPLVRTAFATTAGPPLIGVLKGTARLQLLVGVMLAVGAAV